MVVACHVKCCRFGASSVYTIQPCTRLQCHFIQSHIGRMYSCLAVTCHLHFWQNDRGLLRATCGNTGVERILKWVSTESWPWRRKFSCCSCQESNPWPFHCCSPLFFPSLMYATAPTEMVPLFWENDQGVSHSVILPAACQQRLGPFSQALGHTAAKNSVYWHTHTHTHTYKRTLLMIAN